MDNIVKTLTNAEVLSIMKDIMDEECAQHVRTCSRMTNEERMNNLQYLSGMRYMMIETLLRMEYKYA